MGSHFFHHSTGAYLVDRDFANCTAIRRSQFAHEMHAKRNSHLVHILEMVELARDTKASAHSPWGVYATAWVLRWATNTLLTPYRSRARRSPHQFGRSWVVRGCRTVVCTSSSAARAAMGHWANMHPHPRDNRPLLDHLG